MDRFTLLAWAGLSVVVVAAAALVRYRRTGQLDIELSEFIVLVASVLGVVSSVQLLYKAVVLNAWQNCLGSDVTTLIFGALALLWVSVQEVWKVFS